MDKKYMEYAIELAEKGGGFVNPNPLVGAVIVKNNQIIGRGYHKVYGGPHAEINAFENATEDTKGSTIYVTLEPCSHYGKTPPCVETIIRKGIKKVVIGMVDPNPLVSGKAVKILKENGIEVVTGVLEENIKEQNEVFIKYITTKKPFCLFKTAMTLDGKIATYTGDSKWVTGEESRKHVHKIRQRVAGILVGVGTVIADNPMLTTRLEGVDISNSIRIIVDTKGRIPLESNIVNSSKDIRTILATTNLASSEKVEKLEEKGIEILKAPLKDEKVDISYIVSKLGRMGVDSILIEGGATLAASFFKEELIDKALFFIAPKIIGGEKSKTPLGGEGIPQMKDAINIEDMKVEMIDGDILISGYTIRR